MTITIHSRSYTATAESDILAIPFADALHRACDRYLAGYLPHDEWSDLMATIWQDAARAGVDDTVMRLVDPLRRTYDTP